MYLQSKKELVLWKEPRNLNGSKLFLYKLRIYALEFKIADRIFGVNVVQQLKNEQVIYSLLIKILLDYLIAG